MVKCKNPQTSGGMGAKIHQKIADDLLLSQGGDARADLPAGRGQHGPARDETEDVRANIRQPRAQAAPENGTLDSRQLCLK